MSLCVIHTRDVYFRNVLTADLIVVLTDRQLLSLEDGSAVGEEKAQHIYFK